MEENIAKLGINPNIILRELDLTKESYLQKQRSKSKTPRSSQSTSSTPRLSKSSEVNISSDSTLKTPLALQSASSPRPKTLGKSFNDNSIQIPDIGSFVSLDDIPITPFSDINLSETCQNDIIVLPFDIAIEPVDDENCAGTSAKEIKIDYVELIQDIATAEAAPLDKDLQLHCNESFDISLVLPETSVKISDKENNYPVIESQDNPLKTRPTTNTDLASTVEIHHFNALKQDNSDFIASTEKQPSVTSTELITDDIDPFKKHLKFPNVVTQNKVNRKSNQFPSAIASKAWQQYHENKENEKQDKKNKIKKRKLEKELKNKEPPQKKKKKKINKKTIIKKKKLEETKTRIKCGSCDLHLISDTEEEGEKNIGCDKCIRWYHLKWTKLNNLSYIDAAAAQYECELCEATQNATREVLKAFENKTDD